MIKSQPHFMWGQSTWLVIDLGDTRAMRSHSCRGSRVGEMERFVRAVHVLAPIEPLYTRSDGVMNPVSGQNQKRAQGCVGPLASSKIDRRILLFPCKEKC